MYIYTHTYTYVCVHGRMLKDQETQRCLATELPPLPERAFRIFELRAVRSRA